MKKLSLLIVSLISVTAFSQVAIGKSEVSNTSISLEFYDGADNNKGLILPWVNSESSIQNPVNGTFIFDASVKKVKLYQANSWVDLSVNDNGFVDTSLQNNLTENNTAKVFLGENPENDTNDGILVLGDSRKAMVLPLVENPHLNIINPEPGTMAFDTVNKQLAVYNGSVWTFWMP